MTNKLVDYKNFAMACKDQVLFTSLRNKTSTRYQVGHFESDKLILDWNYDIKNQKQLSMLRNTVFKRNEEANICISNTNTVCETLVNFKRLLSLIIGNYVGRNTRRKQSCTEHQSR